MAAPQGPSDEPWLLTGGPLGLGSGVGASVGDGAVLGVLLGDLLGVAVELLGAGLGLSWVQATGPTRKATTKAAVMTGRRTALLGWIGCPAARRGDVERRDVGA
ncbi:hypothetical protein GCM10010317_077040 [Streptomyces mirabilis]|nr:hypothetical protein GCM10010317_077040 [Streptomyces mirabilis]